MIGPAKAMLLYFLFSDIYNGSLKGIDPVLPRFHIDVICGYIQKTHGFKLHAGLGGAETKKDSA
jgi:hypothetical protein